MPLKKLSTEQLLHLISQERKKFLLAIDYGATGSDLEEIRDYIKQLEEVLATRNVELPKDQFQQEKQKKNQRDSSDKNDRKSSVA